MANIGNKHPNVEGGSYDNGVGTTNGVGPNNGVGGNSASGIGANDGGHHFMGNNAGNTNYSGTSPHLRHLGNPAPLGLIAFASTLLVFELINVHARHTAELNIVIALALAYGGITQLLAGMWEFACGNTFGATVFSSFGAFWISYAIILLPGSGIISAYTSQNDLSNAYGFFFTAWFITTFCFLMASMRSTAVLVLFFLFLDLTFLLHMAGAYTGRSGVNKGAGWMGIISALIAYYAGWSALMTRDASYFTLPVVPLSKRRV